MTASLTVLGFRAGRPDPVSSCSGYLIEDGDTTVLVDCGPGIISQLLARDLTHRLDAIVLTHLHQDHCFDVVPLAFNRLLTTATVPKIPLFVPEDSLPVLDTLDEWIAVPSDPQVGKPLQAAFDIRPMVRDGGTELQVAGGITLTPFRAEHVVPSAALRFGLSSGTLAFSSDTGWCPGVLDAARGADLFVCETTYLDQDPAMLAEHGHLTADLTGKLAAEAGVGHLLVSHLIGEADQESFEAARAAAVGVDTCTLAQVGLELAIGKDR